MHPRPRPPGTGSPSRRIRDRCRSPGSDWVPSKRRSRSVLASHITSVSSRGLELAADASQPAFPAGYSYAEAPSGGTHQPALRHSGRLCLPTIGPLLRASDYGLGPKNAYLAPVPSSDYAHLGLAQTFRARIAVGVMVRPRRAELRLPPGRFLHPELPRLRGWGGERAPAGLCLPLKIRFCLRVSARHRPNPWTSRLLAHHMLPRPPRRDTITWSRVPSVPARLLDSSAGLRHSD